MITLFQRLADGELSLKSPRVTSEAASAAASTDARSFGVGASVSGVPPADSGGNRITATGTPPTWNRFVTGVSPTSKKFRGRDAPNHAAAPADNMPQSTCRASYTARTASGEASPVFAGSGSSVSGENSSAPTSVRVGTGSRR